MSHIALPELHKSVRPDEFDSLESACERAGCWPARPVSPLGLHWDGSLKGRLSLRLFCALYAVYSWLAALGRSKSRR